jgi:chitodextrinase
VTATALSSSEVLVEWTPVTDAEGGVKHYKVYRNGMLVGSPTTISFTDSGLQPATKYTYEVSAVDSKNREGEKSEPVSVTTLPGDDDDDDDDDGDDTPPTKPQNLQADAVGPRQVDLAWDAASDPESGVASYRVYRDGAAIASPSGTSFSDTGVDPETSYTYEVSAVNGEGLEGPNGEIGGPSVAHPFGRIGRQGRSDPLIGERSGHRIGPAREQGRKRRSEERVRHEGQAGRIGTGLVKAGDHGDAQVLGGPGRSGDRFQG